MVKRAHVSPSGFSDEAATVPPDSSQSSGEHCPNTVREVSGRCEAVRGGGKASSPA
jgi:hypothetical protein